VSWERKVASYTLGNERGMSMSPLGARMESFLNVLKTGSLYYAPGTAFDLGNAGAINIRTNTGELGAQLVLRQRGLRIKACGSDPGANDVRLQNTHWARLPGPPAYSVLKQNKPIR